MVQISIENILAIDPKDLTPEEKDDLYENLIWLDIKPNTPQDKLEPLFIITKEVMKYKGDQVESLLADLDILASSAGGGNEEIQAELATSLKKIEALNEEIQNKDTELNNERQQIEKLLSDIAELQKEKGELRKEIMVLQTEGQPEFGTNIQEDSSDDATQLKDMIQHKNKHILQLLSDIQILEKENELLNTKLNSNRQELSDATTNLTKYSGENISLRQSNEEFHEKLMMLEERNGALTSQVSELVEERNKRESHLDDLIDALEERVTKWQEILSQKDEEVTELRTKLIETAQSPKRNGSMAFMANYKELTKTIEEQEEAIKQLHEQLKCATEDMTKSSMQVQELKQKAEERDDSDDESIKYEELKEELEKSRNQIIFLQDKVNDAEQDAQFRAEEMTELIIQLREYEEGVYGLSEARNQVKDLKKQLKIRDAQILKLIEQINILTLQSGEEVSVDNENYEKYFEDDEKNSNIDLHTQLNAVQQTAINLSMQNFDLRAKVVKLNEELKNKDVVKTIEQDSVDKKELEDKLRFAIEENESLRKGLDEILQSIKDQDGSRKVVIKSECLETLLEALDARHVSGWYHPAMRLQAVINKMQGTNDALRQELRESRYRESYFQSELQTAMMQLGEMQEKFNIFEGNEKPTPPIPAPRKQLDKPREETDTEDKEKVMPNGSSTTNLQEMKDTLELVNASSPSHTTDAQVQTDSLQFVETAVQTETTTDSENDAINLDYEGDLEPVKESKEENGTGTTKLIDTIDNTIVDKEQIQNGTKVSDLIDKFNTKEETLVRKESATGNDIIVSDLTTEQNGSPKLKNKLLEIETDLRNKCDELRSEFENIKKMNENALLELYKNKEELFGEVKTAMMKVNEEVKSLKESAEKPQPNEFTLGAFKEQETKLLSYGVELGDLRRSLTEKDSYISSLESKVKSLNLKLDEKATQKREQEDKRIKVFKETVSSLQLIINKKESAIGRYKNMLQESSNEYGQLLEKFHLMERTAETLPIPRAPLAESKSVSILMKKWIERVQGLELEIDSLTHKLIETTNHLEASKSETEYWKNIAASLSDKEKCTKEEEQQKNQMEINELRKNIKELKEETEMLFQEKLRKENSKFKKKEDELNNLLKTLENENSRLKHQINIRSAKMTTRSSKKEMVLLEKIKELEDEIEKTKSREKSQVQMRRDKCSDEVAKWEEKKKLQATNEKYKQELKDKGAQMELLETQISRLKVIIAKMERERISLQRKYKVSEGLLAKYINEEGKPSEFDEKSIDSRIETPPIPEYTPRSQRTGSQNSDLHDPRIQVQSRRDLVRAIAALKKVISKLRSEHSNYYHRDYVEQLQNELRKMENNYMDAVERTLALEEQLRDIESRNLGETYTVGGSDDKTEIVFLKEQLTQKCELLSKVKILLQRAILREKQLIQQVTYLEKLVPPEKLAFLHEEAREI